MTLTVLAANVVHTMDPTRPTAAAVAVAAGRIVAVGSRAEVLARVGEHAPVMHLDGALLPGFIDAHHHFCVAALDRRALDLHLPPGATIADLQARVAAQRDRTPGSGWLRLQGYDPLKLAERRAPTAAELDEVCADRPLLVASYSFHEGVLNTSGLAAMGWQAGSPDPPHGRLVRRRGRLTGEVLEAAFFLAEAVSRGSLLAHSGDAWLAEAQAHGRALLAHGIVRVGDAAVPPEFDPLYDRAVEAGMLPVTVHRMPVAQRSFLEPRGAAGRATGEGPAGAPTGPAKLFLDGADRCAVCVSGAQLATLVGATLRKAVTGGGLAALRAGTRMGRIRLAGRHFTIGKPFWEPDDLRAAIRVAAAHGHQIAIHALGNWAVRRACDALDQVGDLRERPGRPRLEHAMLLDAGLESRIADCGAVAVVQPSFLHEIGDELLQRGLPTGLSVNPLATLAAAGVTVAGSSDYPVAGCDVMTAIRAAVTRETASGTKLHAHEAISVQDALAAYTRGGAIALGVDREAGTITAGKVADLVLLSADPLTTEPARLSDIAVLATWRDGIMVHRLS
ncbi:amidohydrolase family protein [Mycobacterium sp.]|uniref:amidohydrolase n=1 Tax=Mycobacterium sp. TaxID=1785 RepID=UPI0012787189|nr:amidohydrolase family protein [Mycobacterium sp.]KAA8963998.1 MAG: amidohydrolase family protein [Mycobacterium sp.]